jgi:hypothetical protein
MRRQCLGLLILCVLAFPPLAEAQCRKRILVYLDVSGSMKPDIRKLKTPQDQQSSPYQQALGGLEALFQQQGFVEPNDVVRVVRFSKAVEQADSAEGPAAVAQLIQVLRGNTFDRLETDFRAAFGDLAKELPVGTFDRQVVLIASDLAHEPVNKMPSTQAIPDWQAALSQAETELAGLFTSSNAAVVLFRPPALGREPQATAGQVLADLRASFPIAGEVASGTGAGAAVIIEQLAQTLRKGLLTPPDLQVSRDGADADRLLFQVTNNNCVPLHIKRLTATPEGGRPSYFDEFSAEEKEVGARQTRQRTQQIRRQLPPGDEWQDAQLAATVETDEGVDGKSAGTTGSWIGYSAASAVFERRPLLPDVLRLDLDLTGFTDPAAAVTWALTVGEDASPLARAKFEGPALSTEARHFRIVLPLMGDGAAAEAVQVAIAGGALQGVEEPKIRLVEDQQSSHHHRVFGGVALIAILGVAVAALWVRAARAKYPIFRLTRRDNAQWGAAMAIAVLLVLSYWLRIPLLNRWSPGKVEPWLSGFAVVAVFGLTAFLLLEIFRTRFARAVVEEQVMPLPTYLRRGKLDTWLPWGMGLAAAALVFALFWPLRPAGSPESRRGEDQAHTRLHVTSDQR